MKTKIILAVLIPAIICSGIFLVPDVLGSEDTGTYRIQEYNVVLLPHPNGEFEISYTQKWLVTGGHIPWVTVGTANPDFDIQNFGGAAKVAEPANQVDWYGVRIDLDRDYQPHETFQFNFTIIQRRLLDRADNGYHLVYTPGWYDRALTDALTVKLVSPGKVADLITDPQPDSISGQEVIWTKKNLGKGERFTVSIGFPSGIYNESLMDKSVQGGISPPLLPPPPDISTQGSGEHNWIMVVLIIVICIIGIVALASTNRKDDAERDGSSYTSPEIYSGSSRRSSHIHSTGRGISCVHTCACACVSCACACACAGGGGAGCKKPHHSCPVCSPKSIVKNDNLKS